MRTRSLLTFIFVLLASTATAEYWGNFPDGGTLYFYTNTVGTDGVAETPVSEAIAVYKDGSGTQLTTGATIDDDFDSVVGFHKVTIDTTQSGFDAGSHYTVQYTAGTVDSVSVVGRVIGSFYLGNKPADVDTIKTNPVVNGGTIIFPTGATLASTTNISAATGIDVTKVGGASLGTASSGYFPADVRHFGGSAGMFSSGVPTVALATSQGAITFSDLNVTNNVALADGFTIARSTLNQPAVSLTGSGTGAGLHVSGGENGTGVSIIGGDSSGDGITVETTEGRGVYVNADGSNMDAVRLDSFDGSGIDVDAGGNAAVSIVGNGGDGVSIESEDHYGLRITTQDGNAAVEIATSQEGTGDGLSITSGTNGDAIRLKGIGAGNGLYATGGTTGHDILGNVGGSVESVTGDVGGKMLGGGSATITGTGVRAVDSSGNAIAPASAIATLDDKIDIIDAIVDNIFTAFEADGGVYRLTTNALEQFATDWSATEKNQIRHRLGLDGTTSTPSASPSLGTVNANVTAMANNVMTANAADSGLGTEFGNATWASSSRTLSGTTNDFDEMLEGAPTFAEAMDDHGYTTGRADKIDRLALSLLGSAKVEVVNSQTSLKLDEGPTQDDVFNGSLVIITDASEPAVKAVGLVKDYDGDTKTITLVTDPEIFTITADDTVDVIAAGSPAALWLGSSP